MFYRRGDAQQHSNDDVSPDGKRVLMIQEPEQSDALKQTHLVINWFEELERLVPSE